MIPKYMKALYPWYVAVEIIATGDIQVLK